MKQHNLPIISVLIYPFETNNIPKPPLEEKSGQEKLLEQLVFFLDQRQLDQR